MHWNILPSNMTISHKKIIFMVHKVCRTYKFESFGIIKVLILALILSEVFLELTIFGEYFYIHIKAVILFIIIFCT